MKYKAKISPKLLELSRRGAGGKKVKLLLADGREMCCRFEMLTYANKFDDDDSDVMVAYVKYWDEYEGREIKVYSDHSLDSVYIKSAIELILFLPRVDKRMIKIKGVKEYIMKNRPHRLAA